MRSQPSKVAVSTAPVSAEGKTGEDLANITIKIESYLKDVAQVLGIQDVQSVQFLEMTTGSYNLNYHIKLNDKDLIFRLNVDQQSGLANQIEYEYNVMKLLEGRGIAPRVYHLDNSRERFAFGILIEEYIVGPYLALRDEEMPDVAELLVRLHSLPWGNMQMITWPDPLINNYEQVQSDLRGYEARSAADPRIVRLSREFLAAVEPRVRECRPLFHVDSLNHTDLALDNFIRTSDGLRLIDWEKPRLDDCSYDLCCFLAEPAQLWCSPRVLSPEGRDRILSTYASLSGKPEDVLFNKIRIREPLVALHWIMWSGTKLCDLRERRTTSELMEYHEGKVERWERSASLENVEKLLDQL